MPHLCLSSFRQEHLATNNKMPDLQPLARRKAKSNMPDRASTDYVSCKEQPPPCSPARRHGRTTSSQLQSWIRKQVALLYSFSESSHPSPRLLCMSIMERLCVGQESSVKLLDLPQALVHFGCISPVRSLLDVLVLIVFNLIVGLRMHLAVSSC